MFMGDRQQSTVYIVYAEGEQYKSYVGISV